MPTVVISREPSDEIRAAVKANLPSEVKVVYLHELDQAQRTAALESTDVLAFFMLRKELSPEELPLLAKIPMLQSIPAGVEMLPYEHISPDTVLCANTGGWAWPLAEQVMGMVITLDRELISYSKKLRNGVWDRSSNRCLRGPHHGHPGVRGHRPGHGQAGQGLWHEDHGHQPQRPGRDGGRLHRDRGRPGPGAGSRRM